MRDRPAPTPSTTARIPPRLDCGTGDSFYEATREYAAALTPEQLAFTGAHL